MNQVIILTFLVAVAAGTIYQKSSVLEEPGKIIGGEEIDIEKVPYQVYVRTYINETYWFNCGGTIINKNYILSAAHCFDHQYKSIKIKAGSSILNEGTSFEVEKQISHELYNKETFGDYDVAVLKLKDDIKFDKTKQPIKLADVEPSDGETALISGWGLTKEGPQVIEKKLRAVKIPILGWKKCKDLHGSRLTERMICTAVGNKAQCDGDSGGPVVVNGKVAGIVSWGPKECDTSKQPPVQSNVYNLRKWIKDHLK